MDDMHPKKEKSIFQAGQPGDQETSAHFLPLMYRDLQLLARNLLGQYPHSQTLQATALVHEAYLRLEPQDGTAWNGRHHYFGAAAQAMRRILVDRARRKKAVKHGGKMRRIDLDCDVLSCPQFETDFIALEKALIELKNIDERKVNGVLLRFLSGLTIRETAVALNISEPTVERDWRFSREFLLARLTGKRQPGKSA